MENDPQKIIPARPCQVCGNKNFFWFGQKNSFDLWRCKNCALLFVYPLPDPARVYSEDYFTSAAKGFGYVDYDQDKLPMIPTFKKYLGLLKKQVPSKGRLLDIGAATGFFVRLAKEDGWQAEGVEISDYAAGLGRSRGLNIITGTLTSLSLPAENYNAVTMLDVLEHLTDPLTTLAEVYKVLKPGGLLLINTPDAGSLVAKISGKQWHMLVPPEHLHYFSQTNLTNFLNSNGFKTVLTAKIGKKFTLEYIFKTLYHWQKLSIWKLLSKACQRGWLKKISLPIHLRDNILIIAEKK
ncbi:MAG: class I SAM-dependent methyltransferase [Candidatus Komeilibacteria bacterium]|nr:class I SAM-dependent methyltransferase [Candidatus Komeilibacteria bacterium]